MTLTLELPPELEARMKTNAAVHGKDVTDYLTGTDGRVAERKSRAEMAAASGECFRGQCLMASPSEEPIIWAIRFTDGASDDLQVVEEAMKIEASE